MTLTQSLDAAEIMNQNDVGSLPVVDDDRRLVGILADRDIVLRAVAERVDPQSVKVGDASRDLVTVEPEQDLDEALLLMAQHQVRRLPVVEQDRLVGMLAQADAAIDAKEKKVGETVEQISQPTSTERE